MGFLQDVMAGGVGEMSEWRAWEMGVDMKDPSPAPPRRSWGVDTPELKNVYISV